VCAKNEKGIYYNDKERWGIAIAEGDFVPEDVDVIDASKVAELLGVKEAIDSKAVIEMTEAGALKFDGVEVALPEITNAQVFYGGKLLHRWDAKLEPIEPVILPDVLPPARSLADAIEEMLNG